MRFSMGLCAAAVCAVAIAASAEAGEAAKKKAASSEAVTVTGCLTHDEHMFRLTRVDGAEAPKARNWRSLYVKKSTPRLEIVEAPSKLALKEHVGQRVKITGTMNGDRQIKPRSVQRVSSSCS